MDHSTLHFQLRVDKNSHLPEARNTATMLNQRVCVCVQLVFGHRAYYLGKKFRRLIKKSILNGKYDTTNYLQYHLS